MSDWAIGYKQERIGHVDKKPGDYRFVITGVSEQTSKTTKLPMLVVDMQLNPSGVVVKNYFVKNQYFNRNITEFFDSTGIEPGNFSFATWIGAQGAGRFKVDDKGYLKLNFYLTPAQAKDLPPWEGKAPERQTVTEIAVEDDLPF